MLVSLYKSGVKSHRYLPFDIVIMLGPSAKGGCCRADEYVVWDSKPGPESTERPNWIELKTSLDSQTENQMINFERKLLKFWIQSFLLGVPKIIVGFRTQDGFLKRIEELDTASIPGTVKRAGKGTWDGNMCINFTAVFLGCKCGCCGTSYQQGSLGD